MQEGVVGDMRNPLILTLAAVKAAFVKPSEPPGETAATQSIVASAARIKDRADEFSRLLHNMRRDKKERPMQHQKSR